MDSVDEPSQPASSRRHLFSVGSGGSTAADAPWPDECESFRQTPSQRPDLFSRLITIVGDADALLRLDASPLPDESFDWSAVEPRDVLFVTRVLARSDQCCDEMLDTEFRTIARRILARVAARDPRPLRRSTHVDRCAAALVWLAGQANGEFGRRGMRTAQRLWAWFAVGSCAERGRSLRDAAGLLPEVLDPLAWGTYPLTLGDPALLHSRYRSGLIAQRDTLPAFEKRDRRCSMLPDGRTAQVRAAPVKLVVAGKGIAAEGTRATVVVGLGDDLDDADFFSLSIPEAHELVRLVQRALDAPLPHPGSQS